MVGRCAIGDLGIRAIGDLCGVLWGGSVRHPKMPHRGRNGKICSQNQIILAIPCHRVIKSDGSLGGFSSIGGVNTKKKLLNFEKY